mmetsp:Transcript_19888/g.18900  ORF Transcript_19888/g.18900 Transcript_19888/m.18900 type:complete len:131 (+) Transcript_19888:789-1181(+)
MRYKIPKNNNRYSNYYLDVPGTCQCALDGSEDMYCPYQGRQFAIDYALAYKNVLFNSTRCHIDVWKKHNFFEWEYCVDNITVLEEYKAFYTYVHDWPMSSTNDTYQCYNQINPLNDYELKVYITLPTTAS